ncbi:MAG: hypothetical protein M3P47_01660 [Pseudomonadota bacterium]|nr:hypothetical protein [Pseudomonadota bacterium]
MRLKILLRFAEKIAREFLPGRYLISPDSIGSCNNTVLHRLFHLARLRALGVDFVSRQHQLRHMDFRQGKRLGRVDHVACWSRPVRPKGMTVEEYEATPLSLEVRETRVGNWLLVSQPQRCQNRQP